MKIDGTGSDEFPFFFGSAYFSGAKKLLVCGEGNQLRFQNCLGSCYCMYPPGAHMDPPGGTFQSMIFPRSPGRICWFPGG